jgi:NADH-quinone oxidoreductase subunit J
MNWPFVLIAAMTLAGAVCAMTFRNLVHCALWLMVTFSGLACLYLQLNAEFVGFVQILVYVGAVAILIVFAILLTRNSGQDRKAPLGSPAWPIGVGAAVLVAGALLLSILKSNALGRLTPAAELSVKQIGEQLMTRYILPLEVVALLLTAALIGAVIIAMPEKNKTDDSEDSP